MAGYLDADDLPPSDDDDDDDDDDESLCDGLGGLDALGPDTLCYKECVVTEVNDEWCVLTSRYAFCKGQIFECRLRVEKNGEERDWVERARLLFAASGMVVLCWVWMAVPSATVIVVDALPLSEEQCRWWEEFYVDAFAEYASVHGLGLEDITLRVQSRKQDLVAPPAPAPRPGRRLLLCGLGGGKDSLVARHLCLAQPEVEVVDWVYVADGLDEFDHSKRLNEIVRVSGARCRVLRREFDYESLNKKRATRHDATGHPWAALVAFDSIAAARYYGYEAVVVGNERSASFGNGRYVGELEVNHQFDKSVAVERKINSYAGGAIHYFSPLQPLWEVQIAALMCNEPSLKKYWLLFRSCNDSGDCDEWCGRCDKCAFVCALAAAFSEEHAEIFQGDNLLDRESLLPQFETLAGLNGLPKPLECVGTPQEARLALWLAKRNVKGQNAPFILAALSALDDTQPILDSLHILTDFSDDHNLPSWWSLKDQPEVLVDLQKLASDIRREITVEEQAETIV